MNLLEIIRQELLAQGHRCGHITNHTPDYQRFHIFNPIFNPIAGIHEPTAQLERNGTHLKLTLYHNQDLITDDLILDLTDPTSIPQLTQRLEQLKAPWTPTSPK